MCLEDQRPKQAYCDSDRFQVSPFGVFIAKVSVRCVFDRLYQENWLEQVGNDNDKKKVNRTGVEPRFARNYSYCMAYIHNIQSFKIRCILLVEILSRMS